MDKILVLDFGGQYNQLIARRVREQHIFAEVRGYNKITLEEIRQAGYTGIIFTGGPNSVYDPVSPHFDPAILDAGIPILGICYGCQLMAWMGNGEICSAGAISEYGKVALQVIPGGEMGLPAEAESKMPEQTTENNLERTLEKTLGEENRQLLENRGRLFDHIPETSICWMSHTDYIKTAPAGFTVIAKTDHCPCAAMCDPSRKLYAVQFHPEVTHTEYGTQILKNFLYDICGCKGDWRMRDFCRKSIEEIREKVGDGQVLLALSGGVDSSVCAALLAEAVGRQLTCVFVDHGLMRKDEGDEVEAAFSKWDINLIRVDASERFLSKLAGVTEPETKRKIIGEEFIRVFEDVGHQIGKVDYLAQGTIYPDVIESGLGASAVIKSHHNVGGLPAAVDFKEIIEPLRLLFKDEVRQLGRELGLAEYLVSRQPFPGPGLAIRIIGEITKEKLDLLREADAIFREEMAKSGEDRKTSQYFAVLTNGRSVGVMGDARTYGWTVAIRGVTTDDFMTADWARIPFDVLEKTSSRITNEVKNISRVVYDITSKPPATVEWE